MSDKPPAAPPHDEPTPDKPVNSPSPEALDIKLNFDHHQAELDADVRYMLIQGQLLRERSKDVGGRRRTSSRSD